MTGMLKVRWRDVVYEVPVCHTIAECDVISARWPDGVIDLIAMMEPGRSPLSMRRRVWLANVVLRMAGEIPIDTAVPAMLGARARTRPATGIQLTARAASPPMRFPLR